MKLSFFFFLGFTAIAQVQPRSDLGDKYQSLETLARGMFYLEQLYVDPSKVDQNQLVSQALKGIVEDLDPHTMIMPPKAFVQLTDDTRGKFGGVGIIVSHERGRLIVVSAIEDTPAHKVGIMTGDEIVAIDNIDVNTYDQNTAVDKMRGSPGSKLKLRVKREGVEKPIDFVIIREIIKVRSTRSQRLSEGIVYSRISSFQESTAEELKAIVEKEPDAKGMIIDLRDNPGGLLDQAVQVADLFIPSGIIVSTVGRDPKKIEREFAHKRHTNETLPLTILVNGGSASASEIVAGALQDHNRALIIGTTTFGKGSVQTLVSLPDGSGLKITVARYFTPKDRSIQAKGIKPDLIVSAHTPEKPLSQPEKKETDLKGHLESKDLSDIADQLDPIQQKEWPEIFRKDQQLIAAYNHLTKGSKTKL
jgi:carboxyl-terminal processing protease